MKLVLKSVALACVAGSLSFGSYALAAQDNRPDRNEPREATQAPHADRNDKPEASRDSRKGPEKKWRKGGKIERSDWNRGHKVDYRQHKLRKPPRGYEWREVDGNYVLAAAATGLIASIILSN
jgi:Ni/Co efflux regulator RcnB